MRLSSGSWDATALSVPFALFPGSNKRKAEQHDHEQSKTIVDKDESFRSIDKCKVPVLLKSKGPGALFRKHSRPKRLILKGSARSQAFSGLLLISALNTWHDVIWNLHMELSNQRRPLCQARRLPQI